MNWDLSSYFPFDGPEMRRFKQELAHDLDALEQEAASLPPLDGDNTDPWAAVFARAPRSCWHGSPTSAPTSAA